jgi:hypothetical protein
LTCCGYNVIAPELGIVWADTELYAEGVPSRHRSKLSANAVGAIVGGGTGLVGFLREAEELVADALSFDQVVVDLPNRLARAARDLVEHRIAAASTHQVYFACGWSHQMGRILGAVFHAARNFAPVIALSFSAPAVEVGDVDGAEAVVAACQQQMLLVQQRNPRAGDGVICMARLTPSSITARPIFDLAAGRMVRRPFKFDAEGLDARPGFQPGASSQLGP